MSEPMRDHHHSQEAYAEMFERMQLAGWIGRLARDPQGHYSYEPTEHGKTAMQALAAVFADLAGGDPGELPSHVVLALYEHVFSVTRPKS